ncbi:MAG: hypothetical protein QNJ81_04355 [Acidimicrobiia bacterium]|nr:hypothetical protein [Acidimicrobiia bacterium]
MTASPPHIGMLREKPLHASLKLWCAEEGDRLEVKVDRYVIDVVRDDLLIEIQTRGFSSMKKKLTRLLELNYRVRVVHPIPVTKRIVRLGEDGEILGKRRSPKRGTVLDVFAELVSFPGLLSDPNLEIEVVLTEEDEYRKHEENKAWRRRGWVVQERRLTGIQDVIRITEPVDLVALISADLPERFTTADIAEATGATRRLAQQAAYCLRHMNAIEATGKSGRAIEYRLV